MSDTDRIKLSYEELGRPEVDRALADIRTQQKAAAAKAKAGVKGLRARAVRKFLLLALAGLLGLILTLSLLYFGRSLISGKLGHQDNEAGESSKPPLQQKTKRI